MATKTTIVVGRVADGLVSPIVVADEAFTSVNLAVADESFTSSYGVAVQLANTYIADGSVTVEDDEETPFVEDEDYTIDYSAGTITVLSDGDMEDDTEYFITYHSCPPIKLAHEHLEADSVVVDDGENPALIEDTDFTVDYVAGTITAIYDGGMADDTEYFIDYNWNDPKLLCYKINAVTSAASNVLWVCTSRAGCNGVAIIVYEE